LLTNCGIKLKNIRYIFVILMLIFTSFLGVQVIAHPPENIDLSFNNQTNILTAIITHNTENPNSHYVESVEVYKNEIQIIDEDYNNQPTSDTFTLTFTIDAVAGDVLKVEARDNFNDKTEKSIIVTDNAENNPPSNPTITGEINGKAGIEYGYSFTSSDPDGDDIYYCIQWEDESGVICIGPFPSSIEQYATHIWTEEGEYTVKVKARDTKGAESEWATLEITMPKPILINTLISKLYVKYPILDKIFSALFNI
jgi:hypothetical protein